MSVRVRTVEVLNGLRLRLTFDDGIVTEADFSDDLWGPLAEPLRDPTARPDPVTARPDPVVHCLVHVSLGVHG